MNIHVDLETCGSNTLSYCLLVYFVFLWQVGSTVVNEDCTLVSTCVRDGGGAYFEHVELEPCGSNKVCRPVDGIRECTCKPGFMLVNDICQGWYWSLLWVVIIE